MLSGPLGGLALGLNLFLEREGVDFLGVEVPWLVRSPVDSLKL